MVYLHFPTNLTDEEHLLDQKYAKLRRKKKALERYQAPKVEPAASNPLKRPLEPKDAKEYAKKMILAGKITVGNKDAAARTVFRRPGGLQRKLAESRGRSLAAAEATATATATATHVNSSPPKPTITASAISSGVISRAPVFKLKQATGIQRITSTSTSADQQLQVTELTEQSGEMPSTSSEVNQSTLQYQPFTPASTASDASKTENPPKYRPVSGPRMRVVSLSSVDGRSMRKEGKPRQGNTIHIRGRNLNEEICREACGKIGHIVNLTLELEKSCAFVTFDKIESAEKAIVELNGSSIGDEVQIQVSFARRQPAVAELINDAPASATWTALASSQSQKGAHHDKREQVVYDTEDFVIPEPEPEPEPMEITASRSSSTTTLKPIMIGLNPMNPMP